MKLVQGEPPNFVKIATAFPASRNSGTIFAYGDTVYHIGPIFFSDALRAHEAVHLRQQAAFGDITMGLYARAEAWWNRYIVNTEFRFQQELEAHVVEFGTIVKSGANRHQRRMSRKIIAKRLSGPLYGHACTYEKALAYMSAVENTTGATEEESVH